MTSSELDSATFQLITQPLNHLRYPVRTFRIYSRKENLCHSACLAKNAVEEFGRESGDCSTDASTAVNIKITAFWGKTRAALNRTLFYRIVGRRAKFLDNMLFGLGSQRAHICWCKCGMSTAK
jgi:hypothetical protein